MTSLRSIPIGSLALSVGNHLWQSTLIILLAALLIRVLRKNNAQSRYWIWVAASLKFLVPFSFLVSAGNYLPHSGNPVAVRPLLSFALSEINQPFTIHIPSTALASSNVEPHILAAAVLAIWAGGALIVAGAWLTRWQRVRLIVREATLLYQGPELTALRRIEDALRVRTPLRILLAREPIEPGIFGLFQPVLLWPAGITQHLDQAHIESILAHELQHVRRRDNLIAALHMLVEALFWFHPLVWWLGVRLIDERERACDEAVVRGGSEPGHYAESILKTCEFFLAPSLPCVSGITGADLKQRVVHILTMPVSFRLTLGRKVLLLACGMMAVALPVVSGRVNTINALFVLAPPSPPPLPPPPPPPKHGEMPDRFPQ